VKVRRLTNAVLLSELDGDLRFILSPPWACTAVMSMMPDLLRFSQARKYVPRGEPGPHPLRVARPCPSAF
jgi:hypothetical protein